MRPSSSRKGLIWSVLLLLGALLLAEAGLRMYASAHDLEPEELGRRGAEAETAGAELSTFDLLRPSHHDRVIYELEAGVRGTLGGRLVETNAHGFRGRERDLEKPAGVFRIVGLGDARMFGSGVAEGQTFLDLLERRLNAAGRGEQRYEALNFAVPGFNTVQEVAMLEHRALAFDPDLVMVHFVGDDVGGPRFVRGPAAESRSPSYLVRWLGALRQAEPAGAPTLVRASELGREQLLESVGDAPEWGRQGVVSALERLAELVAERRTPVIVMMLGDEGADRAAVRDAAGRLGFRTVNAVRRFRDHLDADGIELTREAWRRAFFLHGDHPTPLAHRLYAEVLFDELVGMGLTKRLPET